jgi:hypothetical protein
MELQFVRIKFFHLRKNGVERGNQEMKTKKEINECIEECEGALMIAAVH